MPYQNKLFKQYPSSNWLQKNRNTIWTFKCHVLNSKDLEKTNYPQHNKTTAMQTLELIQVLRKGKHTIYH